MPIPYLESVKVMPMPALKVQVEALKEAKAQLAKARAHYAEIAPVGSSSELEAQSAVVKACSEAVSAAITMGCEPCPGCGKLPHGMEQPGKRGASEFEIGCLACKPFTHADGTRREYHVRGGLLPSHAVDAWNAGPDFWLVEVSPEVKNASVPEKESSE